MFRKGLGFTPIEGKSALEAGTVEAPRDSGTFAPPAACPNEADASGDEPAT
jgi:hypothetical protein